jgi:hypothetical protein
MLNPEDPNLGSRLMRTLDRLGVPERASRGLTAANRLRYQYTFRLCLAKTAFSERQ